MEVGPAGAHGAIREAIMKEKEHAPIQNQPTGDHNVEVKPLFKSIEKW